MEPGQTPISLRARRPERSDGMTGVGGAARAPAQDFAHRQLQSLVPHVAYLHEPMNGAEKGGDLVFFDVNETRMIVLIADISGDGEKPEQHRIPIILGNRKLFLSSGADTTPSQSFSLLQKRLEQLPSEGSQYITGCFSVLDLATGKLSYTLAAHPRILHYHADDRTMTKLGEQDEHAGVIFLGKNEFLPAHEFKDGHTTVSKGDVLIYRTDGLSDIVPRMDFPKQEFYALIIQNAHLSAPEIRDEIRRFLESFVGHGTDISKHTDVGLIVVKIE